MHAYIQLVFKIIAHPQIVIADKKMNRYPGIACCCSVDSINKKSVVPAVSVLSVFHNFLNTDEIDTAGTTDFFYA